MWYVWPARARRRSIRRSYTKGMWRGSVERGVNEAIHAPLADSRRRSVRTQIRYLPTDTVTFTNLPPVFQDTATGPSPHPPLFKGKGRAPEPLAGRAPAVPAAVPSAWPKAPSTASAPTTPSRTHAPAAPQQQRAAPSSDESCACTRARRRTRERDAAAGPRPAARVPAARRRRHHCSFAFARSVPDPQRVAGAQRFLHACERATYPRDVRDETRAARASARGVHGRVALAWTEEPTRRTHRVRHEFAQVDRSMRL